jgi:type II secretion system protein N
MRFSPEQERWAKRLGYPALALVTFVMGVHFMFPYDRVKQTVIDRLSGSYDVEIDELGPGWWPGRYRVEGLTLISRPKEGEKPRRLRVDRIDVNIGLFALIGKKLSVDLDAELGDGTVSGTVVVAQSGAIALDLHTKDLPLETIPGLGSVIGGAPIKGGLAMDIDLRLPTKAARDMEGTVTLTCTDCVVGDGVTKVKLGGGTTKEGQPIPPPADGGGFTLPRIKVGNIDGKIVIGRGAICIERMRSKSVHGELELAGGILIQEPFIQSQTQLYARLKMTDAFKAESSRNRDFEILTFAAARQPDGFSAYSARTSLQMFKWLIAKRAMEPLAECKGVGEPVKAPEPKRETASTPPPPTPQVAVPATGGTQANAPPPPEVPPPAPETPPAPTPAPEPTPDPPKQVEPVPVPVPPPPEPAPPPVEQPPQQPSPDMTPPQPPID